MTETPEPRTERTAVEPAPTGPVYRDQAAAQAVYRHSRLNAVLAWVGIVAGIVFIVAVVFFSGFALGRHAGGGGHGGWGHHWHGAAMGHQGGAPMWHRGGGPGEWGGGPGAGPGQYGGGPGGSQSPTTSPSAPH
ncbi:MAG TPA: hypothetical protein VMU34_10020 [Mycobacterium sp.]|nr:hypothetical protein [Mycobacterium sp.]